MNLFILTIFTLSIIMLGHAKPYGGGHRGGGDYSSGGGFVHHDENTYSDVHHSNCGPAGCPIGDGGNGFGTSGSLGVHGHLPQPLPSVSIISGPFGGFPDNNNNNFDKGNEIGSSTLQGIGHVGKPDGFSGSVNHGIKGHSGTTNPGRAIFSVNPGTHVGHSFPEHGEYHNSPNYGNSVRRHPPGFYDRDHRVFDHGPSHNFVPDGSLANPGRGLSPGIFDGLQENYMHSGSRGHTSGYIGSVGPSYGRSPGIYDNGHDGFKTNLGYDSPRGHIGGSDFYPYDGGYSVQGHVKGHFY